MTRLIVPDMTCDGCMHAVTRAVRTLDAAAKLQIDLDAKTVDIESSHSRAVLAEAIRDAGFTVEASP
jgi:copper chaperone